MRALFTLFLCLTMIRNAETEKGIRLQSAYESLNYITYLVDTNIPSHNEYADILMLSQIIYHESGGEWCGDTMKYYVGSVVLNRVESPLFPDSIHDVIYAPRQYCDVKNIKPTKKCIDIAVDLVHNGSVLPSNVLYQANFKQGHGVYEKILGVYFCYY